MCERRGRWPNEFWALPTNERVDLIAFEMQRREQAAKTVDAALDNARKDGSIPAEVLAAYLLMALVRNG